MRRSATRTLRLAVVVAIPFLIAAPRVVRATPLTAQGIISGYNLVTGSTVASSFDVEGSAIVGGNLTGSNQFFNNSGRAPASPTLSVYGDISGTTKTLAPATVYYSTASGTLSLNAGGTQIQNAYPNSLGAYLAPLNAMSTQLSGMAQQSGNTVGVNSGTVTFNGASGTNGIAYIDVTAAQLATLLPNNTVLFTLGSGVSTIVVNVSGNFSDPGSEHVNSAQTDVLFNFYNAQSITFNSWETSVLAPGAATTTQNAFEGFLYTNTLQAGGEMHNLVYTGYTPPPPPPVPEPASLSVMAAGLFGIAATRRRAKA